MNLPSSSRGFTLLETIVVIAITTVVVLALGMFVVSFYRNDDYVLQEAQAVSSAQQGLTTAMQYLREASYGADGSYPIAYATSTAITFYADVNNDGTVEKVTLRYLNGKVYEAITEPSGNPPSYGNTVSTTTLASYVTNGTTIPVFEFVSSTTALLSTTSPLIITNIYSVITTLKVDVDPNRSPSPYTLTSSAAIRILLGQ
jgi:prepilin-type N-terminal cleavage/methylation domain-containing protein